MGEAFDPYYKWLGIPPKDQPPHHYRLLGIEVFEQDRDVIDAAANRLMGYLKELAVGDEAAHSQKLLNEIARARICLLNVEQRQVYDEQLRAQLAARKPPPRGGLGAAPPPAAAEAPPPKLVDPPPPLPDPSAAGTARGRRAPPAGNRSPRPLPQDASSPAESVPLVQGEQVAASASGGAGTRDEGGGLGGIQIVVDPDGSRARRSSSDGTPKAAVPRRTPAFSPITWGLVLLVLVLCSVLVVVSRWPLSGGISDGPGSGGPPTGRSGLDAGPPILILQLSPEESREITEFRIDDVLQDLPPEPWYRLAPGQHELLLRREGHLPVEDRIEDAESGQRIVFRPEWQPE